MFNPFNLSLFRFFDQTDKSRLGKNTPKKRNDYALLTWREIPITGQKLAKKRYADGRQRNQHWRRRARLNYQVASNGH